MIALTIFLVYLIGYIISICYDSCETTKFFNYVLTDGFFWPIRFLRFFLQRLFHHLKGEKE